MTDDSRPFFTRALDALKHGDRRGAATLLARQLGEGNTAAKNLPSVSQLAAHIGEVDLAVEAMRRAIVPGEIGTLLAYWAVLAGHGRSDEAITDLQRQPSVVRNHPSVLHFRATVAHQLGQFEEAEELFRKALAASPDSMQSWFALAMVKTFHPGDRDFAAMEQLDRRGGGHPQARAGLSYALGKACEDMGDPDRAFEYYKRGAAFLREQTSYDSAPFEHAAERAIENFTPEALDKLAPSGFEGQSPLIVTGLPRSGTTLTEQILRGHSTVVDGAEANLLGPAMMPARGSLSGALAYQEKGGAADPWGEVARDYTGLVERYFRSPGRVVDKSLGQSLLTGLMMHALPNTRIAWLRRNPDDVALSCFRTYFTTGLPWTWSLSDIAATMRAEDRLFEHWRSLFGERIMTVPYEEMVAEPGVWAERLQQHFGLPVEPGIEQPAREGRAIRTASATQAKEPISTARIGQAAKFERQLKPFRDLYYA
jgi:tetratricopeptide (TPR) repeat protein